MPTMRAEMGRNLYEGRPNLVRAEAGRGEKQRPEAPALALHFKADWKSGVNPKFVKRGLPAFEAKRRAEQLQARTP
jgi:hypothetical protein